MHCGSLPVSRSGTLRTTLTDRSHPRRGWFARSRSLIHFQSRPMSSFIVLKVVSFPFKWSPERSCSPLPFAYRSLCKCVLAAHRCNERRRVENIYWKGSGVFTESGGNRRWLPPPPPPFVRSRAFVRARSQMRFCASSIWPGYEPLNGCSTCSHSSLLHRPYFVQMGLHRAGH